MPEKDNTGMGERIQSMDEDAVRHGSLFVELP